MESPQATQKSAVWIFVEDLFFSTTPPVRFDRSLSEEVWRSLTASHSVELLTCNEGQEEESQKMLTQGLKIDMPSIKHKTLKEVLEEARKDKTFKSRIILSDELLSKQAAPLKSELLSSGLIILFMSLFTINESFVGIDYSKLETARSICSLESKLRYFGSPCRIKVGLFFENSYYKPEMAALLKDSEKVEFVPVPFHDVPSIQFDCLVNRATVFQALVELFNEPKKKACVENYLKYEEKFKKTLFLDRFDNSRVTIYRTEFMEELKQQVKEENESIGKKIFDIPWTRGGDYLDILEKDQSDLAISKLASAIPYPLITKSDIACGDPSTHSFMVIKERPTNPTWDQLKQKILNEYFGKKFLVQQFIPNPMNLFLKGTSFFGQFRVVVREGFGEDFEKAQTGAFLRHGQGNVEVRKNEDVMASIPSDLLEHIKAFQLNLAKSLKLDIMGVDYLYDSEKKKVYPIDLNKMPRPENIEGFREILISALSKIEV
jgi:hypothetical protein